MEKDLILFDLDGTLIDPKIGITGSVQYALAHFGIHEDVEVLCKFIGPPLTDAFVRYYHFSPEDTRKAIRFYRERFSEKGVFENTLYEGTVPLLSSLCEQGRKLILATSKPTVFARQIIEYHALTGYFEGIYGSNLNDTRTTKEEVIEFALQKYPSYDRSHAVMVGDREHDIIGAKKNGISSVGVLYGYGSRDELARAGADLLAKDIPELLALLLSPMR